MNARTKISHLFLFNDHSVLKGQLVAYGNLLFFSDYGVL